MKKIYESEKGNICNGEISGKSKIYFLILSIMPCILYNLLLLTPYNNYVFTSIVKIVLFIGSAFLFCAVTKQFQIFDIVKFKGDKKYIKIAVYLGITVMLIIILFFRLLDSFFDKNMILDSLLREGITKQTYPFVFLNIIFVNAFIEEFFFRGFLFMSLCKDKFNLKISLYSAVLFAFYHMTMMVNFFSPVIFILCLLGLIIGGIIFNYIDYKCKNIYGSYIIHAGANMGINLLGLYFFLSV